MEVGMKAVAKKTKKTSSTKATGKRKAESVLSICPVNGAGWCPYPFSTAQLKKRLKRIQQEAESEDSAVKEKNELNKAARTK
jgi:hypothetical protein